MAVPAHKSETEVKPVEVAEDETRTKPADIITTTDELDVAPVASPAKDLQDKLDALYCRVLPCVQGVASRNAL